MGGENLINRLAEGEHSLRRTGIRWGTRIKEHGSLCPEQEIDEVRFEAEAFRDAQDVSVGVEGHDLESRIYATRAVGRAVDPAN
jgi:hypothetical protein